MLNPKPTCTKHLRRKEGKKKGRKEGGKKERKEGKGREGVYSTTTTN
jgi:hypothetical protein